MSNPFTEPTTTFMYTLHLTRPAVLTEGPTEAEAAVVAQHWAYSQDLLARDILIFGGRTLLMTEETFASVVIRASSEQEVREIMDNDPAVKAGFFHARLYPYQAMLMGRL